VKNWFLNFSVPVLLNILISAKEMRSTWKPQKLLPWVGATMLDASTSLS
jgi:hypothetical protein